MHLMDKLTQILNDYPSDRMEHWFARFVKSHYDTVGQMTIDDLAKACNTSSSSISRLINQIGYENYKAFRHDCEDNVKSIHWMIKQSEGQPHFHLDTHNIGQYLNQIVAPVLTDIDQRDVIKARKIIEHYECIYLVSSMTMNAITQYIQFQCTYSYKNKIVIVVHDYEVLSKLKKEDCVIVFSNLGSIFKNGSHLNRYLLKSSAHKVLITSVGHDNRIELFDETIRIINADHPPVSINHSQIYIHIMFFFMEMVLSR